MYKKGWDNMRNKNNIKATIYTVLGIVIAIAALIGITFLYFSGTVLPVYVAGSYILKNRIKRYMLYVALIVVAIVAAKVANYGATFLTKKFHKRKRRQWRLLILHHKKWKYNVKIVIISNKSYKDPKSIFHSYSFSSLFIKRGD